MKKFHITITDNETGEVLVDQDTSAIIGALDNDESTRNIAYTCCNTIDLAATAAGAKQAANKSARELPWCLRRKIEKLSKKI